MSGRGDVIMAGAYRRIEIAAFRRRLLITAPMSGRDEAGDGRVSDAAVVKINAEDSTEEIATASDEGQRILADAIDVLKTYLIA
jgi:hypothetical protein